jgi:hypothetical protein
MSISNENLENELLEEIENLLEQFDEIEEIELPDDLELQELQEANVYSVIATKQDSSRDFDSDANNKPNTIGKNRAEIYKRKIYAKTPQDAIAKFKKLQGADSKYIREPRVVKTVPAEKAKTDKFGRKATPGNIFLKHKDDVKNLDKKNAHIRVVSKTDKGLKPGFRNKSGELEHPNRKLHIKHKDRAPIKRAVYSHLSNKDWDADDHLDNPKYSPTYRSIKRHVGEGKIMEQKIKDLIDNIEIGNADAINASFSTVMAEKVSARLDSLKQEVANVVFKDKIENNEKNN